MSIEFIVSIDLRADKKISTVVSQVAIKWDEDGYGVLGATSPNGKSVYVDVGAIWLHDSITSGFYRFLRVIDHEYAHAFSPRQTKVSDDEERMAERFERAGMWARRAAKPLRSQPPIV